ncbi:MAG: hypothetical protein H0T53_10120 [Herpetosiphonaceae bacterium]|nr:hypothetical protein [Herpetosiphonaceae bacterium]
MSKTPWSNPLFAVSGHLVARYAAALKSACGLDCPLPDFKIDRFGWSPQLAAVLGQDYMTCEAIRYGIILSPDQAAAPLIMRRFSYEPGLITKVYQEAHTTLLHLIEHEPVIVEIDNGLAFCRNVTDVLAITAIHATLTTPQDTLNKTTQLLALAQGLHQESRLLDDNYIQSMLALVKQVGNPRRRPLPPAFHMKGTSSFWAELPSPVYVLRDAQASQSKPIVITIRPEQVPLDIPSKVLDLDVDLVDHLHAAGYLRYMDTEAFFRKRVADLERDTLLNANIQPSEDSAARRRQLARHTNVQALLPPLYWELEGELKRVQAGAPFSATRLSAEGRWAVSAPARANEVMVHLLARFVRYDYRLLSFHHQRIIQAEWLRYSDAKREYLAAHFPYLPDSFATQPPATPAS